MKLFARYGEYYDLIYKDKDYESEAAFVETALQRHSSFDVKNLLDVGCGTGGHALPMIKKGYRVAGLDQSEVMLDRARDKAQKAHLDMEFHQGDAREFDLGVKFDACICMFTVLGYLATTEDVLKGLTNMRKHIKPGGLFICDVWNGLAVLRTLPSVRVKEVVDGDRTLIRTVEPHLDAFNQLCWVNYRLMVTENGRVVDDIRERHLSRFFFPQEIKHYMEDAGFQVLNICPLLDMEGKVDEEVWTIAIIARANSHE